MTQLRSGKFFRMWGRMEGLDHWALPLEGTVGHCFLPLCLLHYFSCATISHHNTLPLQDQSKAVNQPGAEISQTVSQTKCFFISADSSQGKGKRPAQGTEQNSPVDYLSVQDQILQTLDMRSLGLDCSNPSSIPH